MTSTKSDRPGKRNERETKRVACYLSLSAYLTSSIEDFEERAFQSSKLVYSVSQRPPQTCAFQTVQFSGATTRDLHDCRKELFLKRQHGFHDHSLGSQMLLSDLMGYDQSTVLILSHLEIKSVARIKGFCQEMIQN